MFKCPNCGSELMRISGITWNLGGAEKLRCVKCNKEWFWVWCNTSKPNTSFFIEANKDPFEECKKRNLLCKMEKQKTLRDFFA